MRQRLLLIACMVVIFTAGPAVAGDFALFASRWETVDLGGTIGGGARLDLGDGLLGLRAGAAYYNWNPNEIAAEPGGGFADFELKVIPVELGLNINLPLGRRVEVYASGGPAYFFLQPSLGRMSNTMGYYLAAGVKVATAWNLGWFVEADYHKATARLEGDVSAPGMGGRTRFDLGGAGVSAGLTLHF